MKLIIKLVKLEKKLYMGILWFRLEEKIKIDKYQVRSFIDTTFYLLKNAASVTELCIKSKEEFRLFLELKRLYNEISIEGHNIIDAESGIKAFNLEGINIVVNDESIISIADDFLFAKVMSDKEICKELLEKKLLILSNSFFTSQNIDK